MLILEPKSFSFLGGRHQRQWYWNGTHVEGGFKDVDKETSLGDFGGNVALRWEKSLLR